MKRFLMMALAMLIATACGAQPGSGKVKCFTQVEQDTLLRKLFRLTVLSDVVVRQDSAIQVMQSQLKEGEEVLFAVKQKMTLAYGALKDCRTSVAKEVTAKEVAEAKVVSLDKKVVKLKKQRWLFGGIGLAAGIALIILL